MMSLNLLLLSSSKVGNGEYLAAAQKALSEHFTHPEVLFIPYAGVTKSYAEYTQQVQAALADTALKLRGIHEYSDPQQAIRDANGVLVGGGNTFRLLERLYHYDLIEVLKDRGKQGLAYAGWSAGANIAGLSIRTTNDMPIIEPPSFNALQWLPLQLNPHYIDQHPPGFHGETRQQRLAEFMQLYPTTAILALREGAGLKVAGAQQLIIAADEVQKDAALLFRNGDHQPLAAGTELNRLL